MERNDSIRYSTKKLTKLRTGASTVAVAVGATIGLYVTSAMDNPIPPPKDGGYVLRDYYPAMIDDIELANEGAVQRFTERKERLQAEAEKKRLAEAKEKERIESVSRSSEPANNTIVFEASAYVAMCDTGCSGVTAMGHDARETIYYDGYRIIATDPNVIPLGSIVRVHTNGETFEAIAWDTGGYIKGHRIDLLVGSESEAWSFGRKNVGITILKGA